MDFRGTVDSFLHKYDQHPDAINMSKLTKTFVAEMKAGLVGDQSSLMMIPTYLAADGNIPLGETAIAIDAGGTNLRTALVTFTEDGIKVSDFTKRPMPGTQKPLTKDEFLAEMVSYLKPLVPKANKIGFCFSFPAEVQADHDARVVMFCKEVNITGAENMMICREIADALKAAGIDTPVSFVLLNDTVATLLGGPNPDAGERTDGQIGLILGTGTNTAYVEQCANIKKLGAGFESGAMIINTESGIFNKAPQGEFDRRMDAASVNPNDHLFEKMISGVYLGAVIRETVLQAAREELFSAESRVLSLPEISMVEVDAFLRAPFGDNVIANVCATDDDRELMYTFIDRALDRGSKLVTVNMAALMEQMDAGRRMSTPCRIVVEGSTFHKCFSYRERIEHYMKAFVNEQLGRYYLFTSGDDVNLAGSAGAALLNA